MASKVSMITPFRINALRQIAEAAVACEKRTGCPAELLAAQAILESGWLAFAPGCNCFGIKSLSSNPAERQLLHTHEYFTEREAARFVAQGDGRTAVLVPMAKPNKQGRSLYDVTDWFAVFPSLEDCFLHRAQMFASGRYSSYGTLYRRNKNLEAYIRGIAPIYATDEKYADKVLTLVRQSDVAQAISAARG